MFFLQLLSILIGQNKFHLNKPKNNIRNSKNLNFKRLYKKKKKNRKIDFRYFYNNIMITYIMFENVILVDNSTAGRLFYICEYSQNHFNLTLSNLPI